MDLTPFAQAALPIRIHAAAALIAFGLGALQLVRPKGTSAHRRLGFAWVGLMLLVTTGSFAIRTLHHDGSFSAIHALSLGTIVALIYALVAAHRHKARAHAIAMTSIFVGALVIAGLFTLVPGRLMHDVIFGVVPIGAPS